MSNLIYFNHSFINHPMVKEVLKDYNYDWESAGRLAAWEGGMPSLYTRSGFNTLPFKNDIVQYLDAAMPMYDSEFNLTFDECVDQRIIALSKKLQNRPWKVLWSGGIDSTCIVAAILKNLNKADLENIKIVCNRTSIYENPNFYYNFIEPNFAITDYYEFMSNDTLNQNYVIDGNPCDNLFMSGNVIEILGNSAENYIKPWRKNIDTITNLLETKLGKQGARWFVEMTRQNLISTNVPNETIFDFLWWTRFNHGWTHQLLRSILRNVSVDIKSYKKSYVLFFDDKNFEKWSMNNNTFGIKYGNTYSDYKKVVKEYIYDLDRDNYFLNYKTKGHSSSAGQRLSNLTPFALLESGKIINLTTNLKDILELLPNHIENA